MHINKIAKAVFVSGGFLLLGAPTATGLAVAVPNDLSRPSKKRVTTGVLSVVLWYLAFWLFNKADEARSLNASTEDLQSRIDESVQQIRRDYAQVINYAESLGVQPVPVRDTDGRFMPSA